MGGVGPFSGVVLGRPFCSWQQEQRRLQICLLRFCIATTVQTRQRHCGTRGKQQQGECNGTWDGGGGHGGGRRQMRQRLRGAFKQRGLTCRNTLAVQSLTATNSNGLTRLKATLLMIHIGIGCRKQRAVAAARGGMIILRDASICKDARCLV